MTAPAGKGSDLRDRATFPSLDDCPGEYDFDDRYYKFADDNVIRPARHWCFLGEIVAIMAFTRLMVDVRDFNGEIARIACYDDDRGRSFVSKCKEGYTVGVLYGNQHNFLDFSVGFRVEDVTQMTILPFSMQQLLDANEKIFAPPSSCCAANCKGGQEKRLQCSRCRAVIYCSNVHQKEDWPEHKKICKAAAAVRWFSERDWLRFERDFSGERYWSFPKMRPRGVDEADPFPNFSGTLHLS